MRALLLSQLVQANVPRAAAVNSDLIDQKRS